MKKLSDYKGEEAIELWCDVFDPLTRIIADKEIAGVVKSGRPTMEIAKTVLKAHAKDVSEILLRIDPTPLNGLNIILRLIELLNELGDNEEIRSFFGFAAQEKKNNESFGLPTENIGVAEN